MEENFHQSVLSRPNTHSPLTSSEAVQIVELFGTDRLFYFWLCYQILEYEHRKGRKSVKVFHILIAAYAPILTLKTDQRVCSPIFAIIVSMWIKLSLKCMA